MGEVGKRKSCVQRDMGFAQPIRNDEIYVHVRTRSTVTRDRNLQILGELSPLDLFEFSQVDFSFCSRVFGWNWKKGKDPHPQDEIQHLDFTKDPRPLYYKTPPCAFYHKNVCSKAVFGP